jgi:N-glycosylase/DNA lyase
MTANFSALGGIRIQNAIGDGFLHLSEEKLAAKLKELSHRFPNVRANYVVLAQMHKDNLKQTFDSFETEQETRDWIVQNIKGIGMKEGSHFLRNIGYKDLAIIDFHIVDLLVKNNLIEKPKTLTPKKYVEIENVLNEIAQKTNLSLGELDLYLWYEETGKILK